MIEFLGVRLTSRYNNIFEVEGLEQDATLLDLKNAIKDEYGIQVKNQIIFSGKIRNNNDNGNSNSNDNSSNQLMKTELPNILADDFKLDDLTTRELKSLDIAIVYDIQHVLQHPEQLLIKHDKIRMEIDKNHKNDKNKEKKKNNNKDNDEELKDNVQNKMENDANNNNKNININKNKSKDKSGNSDPIPIFVTDTCNEDTKHCIWVRVDNIFIDELKNNGENEEEDDEDEDDENDEDVSWNEQQHLFVLEPQINGIAVNFNQSLAVLCFAFFCVFLFVFFFLVYFECFPL